MIGLLQPILTCEFTAAIFRQSKLRVNPPITIGRNLQNPAVCRDADGEICSKTTGCSREGSREHGIGLAYRVGMFFRCRRDESSSRHLPRGLLVALACVAVGVIVCTVITTGRLFDGIPRLYPLADSRPAVGVKESAHSEIAVIDALQSLPDDYVVLSDLVLPDNDDNVDHLVMGSTGLFVIETENYSTEVKAVGDDWFVNGRKIHSLSRQVQRNAAAIKNNLTPIFSEWHLRAPNVTPLLVFVNPEGHLGIIKPTVPVLRPAALVPFIAERKNADAATLVSREFKLAVVRQLRLLQRMPKEFVPES